MTHTLHIWTLQIYDKMTDTNYQDGFSLFISNLLFNVAKRLFFDTP